MHGLAEDCRIASETPANKGFGKAALMLRPTFKVKPAMGPDGPVESMMNIAIKFDGGDDGVEMTLHGTTMDSTETRINSTRAEMREITLLDHPVWARAATFEQLARGYPVNGRGVEGFAVAHCRVERSGALNRCEPRKEVPDKHGFGVAAAELAHRFVVEIDPDQIPRGPPLWVDIPMRFPAPVAKDERVVTSPTWLRGLDPGRSAKIFPPEAVAQGVTTGRGLVRCVVAANGALTDCTALPGEPEGLGFSEAAVKVASTLRMNPWTADGAPVDGAVIRLPIRFNLKATK